MLHCFIWHHHPQRALGRAHSVSARRQSYLELALQKIILPTWGADASVSQPDGSDEIYLGALQWCTPVVLFSLLGS